MRFPGLRSFCTEFKIYKSNIIAELKVCSNTRNLQRGRELHAEARRSRTDTCMYVATGLVNMYGKCGKMLEARQVFDEMQRPSVVSWTALIFGYAENGEGVTALDLFAKMTSQGCTPNSVTFIAALKACTSFAIQQDKTRCFERGKQIHSQIGFHADINLQNTLIDMYSKCGNMDEARKVFDSMAQKDVVSWNAIILGFVENGDACSALDLFTSMKAERCFPDRITYIAAIKSCTILAGEQYGNGGINCLERGKGIHSQIGCHLDMSVQNTLIAMYAKCRSMLDARQVFDVLKKPNVISWTALILGYAENDEAATALHLFEKMKFEGCKPDCRTFVAVLKACSSFALDQQGKAECLQRGRQIHCEIGDNLDVFVQSSLIDMYSKCANMCEAQCVFENTKCPDVVCWNGLILGYAENGENEKSIELFNRMTYQGCVPNDITFIAVLKACGHLGALDSGRKIHSKINACSTVLVTCLVDFYTRCGSLAEAQKVFDSHPTSRDMRTWTSLLAGYSGVGDIEAVFKLLKGMQDEGFKPSSVTFLCIISCCSHAGMLDKANEYFDVMRSKYEITPTVEHYNCMVDILGRSNKLDDAMEMLRDMVCRPDAVTWMTVLSACRKWKNVLVGMLAFRSLVILDDRKSAAPYVLISNLYYGMWPDQGSALKMHVERTCFGSRIAGEEQVIP